MADNQIIDANTVSKAKGFWDDFNPTSQVAERNYDKAKAVVAKRCWDSSSDTVMIGPHLHLVDAYWAAFIAFLETKGYAQPIQNANYT